MSEFEDINLSSPANVPLGQYSTIYPILGQQQQQHEEPVPPEPVIVSPPVMTQPLGIINKQNGSTAQPQIINYNITYYAPAWSQNRHTECINCCEDCCEDMCENCCLNCCLDCSRVTNRLLGNKGNGYAAMTSDANADKQN